MILLMLNSYSLFDVVIDPHKILNVDNNQYLTKSGSHLLIFTIRLWLTIDISEGNVTDWNKREKVNKHKIKFVAYGQNVKY